MDQLFSKLRKYEIMIRKVANNHLQGEYQSLFKGSGLEFDDLRPYQYGDDVRTIEWKVSAKGHGTFVKTFKEEKTNPSISYWTFLVARTLANKGRKR